DDDRGEGRADPTARDTGSEQRGPGDRPPAEPTGDLGDTDQLVVSEAGPALMRPVAVSSGQDHHPTAGVNVPSGSKARFSANIAALEVLRQLETSNRP